MAEYHNISHLFGGVLTLKYRFTQLFGAFHSVESGSHACLGLSQPVEEVRTTV